MGKYVSGFGSDAMDYTPHEPKREPEESVAVGQAIEDWDLADSVLSTVGSRKIETLVAQALAGRLQRDRPLHEWEPDKLNPRHISVIMMRAVGYKQKRIAELLAYEQSTVSIILNHPDSRRILSAILTESAKKAANISATVQKHAPQMLDIVREVAEDREEKSHVRLKAAFKWLDMYNADRDRAGEGDSEVNLTEESANRLSQALEEASQARDVSYVMLGGGGSSSSGSPSEDSSSLPGEASADSFEQLQADIINALEGEENAA